MLVSPLHHQASLLCFSDICTTWTGKLETAEVLVTTCATSSLPALLISGVCATSGARCGGQSGPKYAGDHFGIISSLLALLISGVCVFLPQVQDVGGQSGPRYAGDHFGIVSSLPALLVFGVCVLYLRCKMWEDRVAPNMLGIILHCLFSAAFAHFWCLCFFTSGARCGGQSGPRYAGDHFGIVSSLLALLIPGVCVFLPQVQDVEGRVAPNMLGIILHCLFSAGLAHLWCLCFFTSGARCGGQSGPQYAGDHFGIVSSLMALLISGVCVFFTSGARCGRAVWPQIIWRPVMQCLSYAGLAHVQCLCNLRCKTWRASCLQRSPWLLRCP